MYSASLVLLYLNTDLQEFPLWPNTLVNKLMINMIHIEKTKREGPLF